jgi:hypothetical protein
MSKKNPRKKRPNPAFVFPGGGESMAAMLGNTAGNLMVSAALVGATLEEKMLISALIPTFLKIIRSSPSIGADALLDKLYPEGVTMDIGGIAELQRNPANAEPKSFEPTPEAKE